MAVERDFFPTDLNRDRTVERFNRDDFNGRLRNESDFGEVTQSVGVLIADAHHADFTCGGRKIGERVRLDWVYDERKRVARIEILPLDATAASGGKARNKAGEEAALGYPAPAVPTVN